MGGSYTPFLGSSQTGLVGIAMQIRRSMLLPAIITALVTPAACTGVGCASLGKPDWLDPGPTRSQQRRAVRFDPYLQDDIAPSSLRVPLMDGARPRDFAAPVPEVRRSRWWAPVQ